MRRMLTAALALMLSFSAFASTPWAQWQQVGRATLTWGPFEVYHSSLLTPGGKYEAQKNGWLEAVEKTWPDVSNGSQIVFLATEKGGQFYSRAPNSVMTAPVGETFSPAVRDAFLAIWLSPATQYPDLRSKLIGASASD